MGLSKDQPDECHGLRPAQMNKTHMFAVLFISFSVSEWDLQVLAYCELSLWLWPFSPVSSNYKNHSFMPLYPSDRISKTVQDKGR